MAGPGGDEQQLHAEGVKTLMSVWPHYAAGTQFYDMLLAKGWLIRNVDGTPDRGGYKHVIGPNIDTTNPEAARWFWEEYLRLRYGLLPYTCSLAYGSYESGAPLCGRCHGVSGRCAGGGPAG